MAVTTPKLPPPPRSAQNRSGSCSWLARTSRPSQEAHAAADGVADHADVRRGARQRGQPVPGRGVHHVEPDDARLHPGGPGHRVDLDAAHPFGLEQHGVCQ